MSVGEIILAALGVAILCIVVISLLESFIEEILYRKDIPDNTKFDIDIKDLDDSEDDE